MIVRTPPTRFATRFPVRVPLRTAADIVIPVGAELFYYLKNTDLDQAVTDQVGLTGVITTTCLDDRNIPQSGGLVKAFPLNTAAFDVGSNMQVWKEATNLISIQSGAPIDMTGITIFDPGGDGIVNIVDDSTILSSSVLRELLSLGGLNGNVFMLSGVSDRVSINILTTGVLTKPSYLKIYARGVGSLHLEGRYGASKTLFNSSAYEAIIHTDTAAIPLSDELSVSVEAGDTAYVILPDLRQDTGMDDTVIITTGAPETRGATVATLPLTALTTSSFKMGGELDGLELVSGSATIWDSGDSSFEFNADLGQFEMKTLANTAVFPVADVSLIGEAYGGYDGVNILCFVDGVAGTGVASTEPVLGATVDVMQDGVGGGYFDSPRIATFYGGAI